MGMANVKESLVPNEERLTDYLAEGAPAPLDEPEQFKLMLTALENLGKRLVAEGFDADAWTTALVALAARSAFERLGPTRAATWFEDCASVILASAAGQTRAQ